MTSASQTRITFASSTWSLLHWQVVLGIAAPWLDLDPKLVECRNPVEWQGCWYYAPPGLPCRRRADSKANAKQINMPSVPWERKEKRPHQICRVRMVSTLEHLSPLHRSNDRGHFHLVLPPEIKLPESLRLTIATLPSVHRLSPKSDLWGSSR